MRGGLLASDRTALSTHLTALVSSAAQLISTVLCFTVSQVFVPLTQWSRPISGSRGGGGRSR